jgi:hypothetical protein
MTKVPTTDQIRDAIDGSTTGEKIGFPDPAVAPLGTDAEAGGNPPTHTERAIEAEAQVEYHEPVPLNGTLIYLPLIAVLAVVIVCVEILALKA